MINVKTTGHIPTRAIDLFDVLADQLDFDSAEFAWAGCIDATQAIPCGSAEPTGFSVNNKGVRQIAATTYIKR